MKKLFLAIILLICSTLSVAQTKTIRGRVIHARTNAPIAKVHIFPEGQREGVFSSPQGLYKIELPKEYFGNLHFERPGYYPFQLRIQKGATIHPNYAEMVPDSLKVDTFCFPSFPENRYLVGEIYERKYHHPVEMAAIRLQDGQILQYSNHRGYFMTGIPLDCDKIIITKEGFEKAGYKIETGRRTYHAGKLYLDALQKDTLTDFWKDKKNTVSWMANEIISGSIGICYERFFALKHSFGLKSSFYLFGRTTGLFEVGTSSYQGIEIATFYRFYPYRTYFKGFFCEPRVIFGYYNFSELSYAYVNYAESIPFKQSVFGVGVLAGVTSVKRDTPSNFPYINVSFGFQYLPLTAPKIYQGDHGPEYELESDFWYLIGPGAMVEIKILIGGIF
jgi:hypothetical protein